MVNHGRKTMQCMSALDVETVTVSTNAFICSSPIHFLIQLNEILCNVSVFFTSPSFLVDCIFFIHFVKSLLTNPQAVSVSTFIYVSLHSIFFHFIRTFLCSLHKHLNAFSSSALCNLNGGRSCLFRPPTCHFLQFFFIIKKHFVSCYFIRPFA